MSGRLSHSQREAVRNFIEFTSTGEQTAIACLSQVGYNVQTAVNNYYQNPQLYTQQPQPQQLHENGGVRKMFERYANEPKDAPKNPDHPNIGPHGVFRLLADLGLDAEDRKVLILAFKMEAKVSCEFAWDEWQKGMKALRAESVDSLRNALDSVDQRLSESNEFKPLYQFTFEYGKKAGQRNLELEVALTYWKILFKDQFALLPLWVEYMRTEHGKGVTKDTWKLLHDFATTINGDLSNYDKEGAWPVVLDNFVDWVRPRLVAGGNGGGEGEESMQS